MLLAPPSAWVRRFAGLIAPGGTVLDLACGSGRHLHWLAAQGWRLTGVDRDAAALAPLAAACPQAELITADIEGGPWPLAGRRFDAIVVTNYLWRPLWPALLDALAEGGVLIYETFAAGHAQYGRPSRPDFLLERGELLRLCEGLRVVAFEDGIEATVPRCVQRIVVMREPPGTPTARLAVLDGPGG
ncbi:SAM-dependent methyltransferase [Rubrivivax sp. A210]|uniref:class I SAM-dependent methyltransferase n=1 Tax=Rubrivivax sp. A210 TaxID=2772301 RepID=UPI00191959F8|nr:class I SAM-dependent methyltransferase [Rubrivivax sp. A210]CAD5374650.1 SAM-dependent methyltransferase [Rubrivivax sp. A210]